MSKSIKKTSHLPSSKVLAALGRVTIHHGILDTVLKATVMVLAEISPEEAQDALEYEGSRTMREMIKKLAVPKLGKTSTATLKLTALLTRCARLTDKRNEYVHSMWLVVDGAPTRLFGGGKPSRAPSSTEINKLADAIFDVGKELYDARRIGGFLHEAMKNATGVKALTKAKTK